MTGGNQIKAFSLKSTGHCILILYVVCHCTKRFVWYFVRVDATKNPDANIYTSAYKGDNKVVIVAINRSTSNVSQNFVLQNGAKVISNAPFTATGDWGAWGEKAISVPMNQGTNTLKLITTGTEGPNIDRVVISAP